MFPPGRKRHRRVWRVNVGRHLAGIGFGLLAYGIWGFFPLFFRQLAHVSPLEVLCHRALWACVFVGLLLSAQRKWRQVRLTVGNPRQLLWLSLAALLIGSNWLIFLWAVDSRQVVASSLGYFLTPLINVLLGLLVLKETLNRWEWFAVGLALLAVVNEIVAVGQLPWISLALAGTFGTYGLVRKRLPIDVLCGLWLETALMLPICALYLGWRWQQGLALLGDHDVMTVSLLISAGALTALPLLAFSAATQRLDLASVGMLIYINPTLQFVIAIQLFGEPLQAARLLSFALIWLGLLVYSVSAWRKYHRPAQRVSE